MASLPSTLALLVAAVFAPLRAQPATLAPGAGRFEVGHGGTLLPVWYFLPDGVRADAPVLMVMHGVKRDAVRYRDEWMPHARRCGLILIAPEFSQEAFPGAERYNLGGAADGPAAFSFIEPIFDAVQAATGNRSARYHLYGHSAGAQFVHRFLFSAPGARVAKAVAANAGWWTLPDPAVDFPYGLRGSTVAVEALKTILQLPLAVLLGTADTDPDDVNLSRTPGALAQGAHRLARGHFFFAAGKSQAAALGVPLGWQLATAPGVGHSNSGMAPFAVRWLFGQPAIAGRDPCPR